jgi:hypothetical protein
LFPKDRKSLNCLPLVLREALSVGVQRHRYPLVPGQTLDGLDIHACAYQVSDVGSAEGVEVIVRANLRLGHKTFVNTNDHFEGCAPLTAEKFLKMLSSQTG